MISTCSCCKEELCESDVDFVESFQITASEELLDFSDVLKREVVYIAGYLAHKHKIALKSEEDKISTEFIDELNRGVLCEPTFGIIFFVDCVVWLHDKKACHTLKNIIFKAYALNNNEREPELGCLRRKEKLSK